VFKLRIIILLVFLVALSIQAQDEVILPDIGDVPLAAKIQVTQDEDDPTTAIVTGEEGAVFPNAVVVVQNRYTADRQITTATVTGSFTTRLYGQNQTPYWVAAFQNFPSEDAINEAMGVTVYGEGDDNTFYVEADLGGNVPRYRISGTHQENSVSLNVEMDLVDDFPNIDDLEIKMELRQFPTGSMERNISISNEDIQVNNNQLRFQVKVMYEQNRNSNGLYFTAYVRSGNGDWQRWENSVLFGTSTENSLSYTFLSYDFSDGIQLPYQLGLSEDVRIYDIDYRVLRPDAYMLELVFPFEDYIPQSVSGELTYAIRKPSGETDTITAQILQSNRSIADGISQLMTNSDLLKSYPFDAYGDYEIYVIQQISYDNGELISQEALYRIRIAEKLYLSPTFMLGTPIVAGDNVSIGAYVIPPVPANVTVDIMTGEGVGAIKGQANLSGYFVGNSALATEVPYSLTYSATYVDTQGRLWSTEDVDMSGIFMSSESDLIHGRRGLAGYDGQQQAWFDSTIYPDNDRNAGRKPYFPYYAGDVAYVPDASDGGIVGGFFSSGTVVSPQGTLLDTNGIYYGLTGDDTFNQQVGMGVDGIRAGDYAFLFGHLATEETFGIYGALMVVEDEDAPARVLSPFMEKLTVFGQEVDMFFVPTGIRPAQVLELGETLAIVGQVAPTLPAEVTVTVTSPSGEQTRFTDTANAIGYFYSADNDMPLDEIGVWNIDIHTTYRGETPAGQLEPPYPEGNINYDIYVVPPDNPPLGDGEFMTETRKVTQTYALEIPDGWTEVRAFATVTTPSWILAQEELTVFPAGTSYTYNPMQLAQQYPNVELLDPAEGNHVADVVTLTLAMTGIDVDGNPAIRTRTYTILHDVTYTYDEAVIR